MPNYILLEKITVGANASSVTFSSIPQTGYTDLVVKMSVRSSRSDIRDWATISFNGSSANITSKRLYGDGSTTGSDSRTDIIVSTTGSSATASTFGDGEFYIPNYTGSTFKSVSVDAVSEHNGATADANLSAGLWSQTAAITSITLTSLTSNAWVQGSTFTLYGVAKLGTTPAIAPKATGGSIIETDGTYWYHAFLASGTFTPVETLSCDYLVVAGGGGATSYYSGGGGGGGLRSATSQSLTSGTAYTATVGAGGNGGTDGTTASSGSSSSFNSLSASGGGKGNTWPVDPGTGTGSGFTGGSGGGASLAFAAGGLGNSGGYSPVEGYNGGAGGKTGGNETTGGGGGAGGVGAAAGNGTTGGAGGIGATSALINAMAAVTGTGVLSGGNYYFAGGGGGSSSASSVGAGGLGGGGAGGFNTGGVLGIANTGGGSGGGAGSSSVSAGGGGSGIVIVRYAV